MVARKEISSAFNISQTKLILRGLISHGITSHQIGVSLCGCVLSSSTKLSRLIACASTKLSSLVKSLLICQGKLKTSSLIGLSSLEGSSLIGLLHTQVLTVHTRSKPTAGVKVGKVSLIERSSLLDVLSLTLTNSLRTGHGLTSNSLIAHL